MVIIAGTLMNALKRVTTVFTMPIAMIPMVVLNVNVKRIGFYEPMIPNVDQMYALMVIMDMECIVNKCLIMLNARKCFQIHFWSVVNRSIFFWSITWTELSEFISCKIIVGTFVRMIDAKTIFVKWDMLMTDRLQPILLNFKALKGMFAKEKI